MKLLDGILVCRRGDGPPKVEWEARGTERGVFSQRSGKGEKGEGESSLLEGGTGVGEVGGFFSSIVFLLSLFLSFSSWDGKALHGFRWGIFTTYNFGFGLLSGRITSYLWRATNLLLIVHREIPYLISIC